MPYGVVWNRKIHKWTVISKSTGKIIGKHDLEVFANKQLASLSGYEEDNKHQKGSKHRL